jgi:hypothetical protein
MSMKKGFWRWALASLSAAVLSGTAEARVIHNPPSVTTNTSAGIIILPKIRVDTTTDSNVTIDTLVQVTNTSNFLTRAHCFYVNANGHCSNDPEQICTQENASEVCPTGGLCLDGWQETEFRLTLTKRQPVSWSASDGRSRSDFPLPGNPGDPPDAQNNQDSAVPPVPEDPFTGELRCIEVSVDAEEPISLNDLKGEATIVTATATNGGFIDARKYNAVGIPSIDGAMEDDDDPGTLNLGGSDAEYNACPNILTLNHYFEGANVVTHTGNFSGDVHSTLTVVPCAADFLNQDQNLTTATIQFLIYNEFEQRFSTSTRVTCYKEVRLSDIDTRPGSDGDQFSIFSIGTQGTLTGSSRLRSVAGSAAYDGRAIIGLLEENWDAGECSNDEDARCDESADCNFGSCVDGSCEDNPNVSCTVDATCTGGTCTDPRTQTTAANVQHTGTRVLGDRIILPLGSIFDDD